MKDNFLISIITVVYNAESEIEKTIDSILNQTYRSFEYIIVDGDSIDNTNLIIEKRLNDGKKEIRVKYISEPDNGIYAAMNKAVKMSEGKYLLFINAGDVLYDDFILEKVLPYMKENLDKDFIYGDVIHYANGWYKKNETEDLNIFKELAYRMPFSHQSVFISRDRLLIHPYDEEYKICADHEFFLSSYLEGKSFYKIPFSISIFELGGVSTTHTVRMKLEVLDIQRRYRVISDKVYISEKERLQTVSERQKNPLREIIKLLIPLCLRKNRDRKKQIKYYTEHGWQRNIPECEEI